MTRQRIAIGLGTKPNYNNEAFKYFILSVNKIQSSYEFCFPYLEEQEYPFTNETCNYEKSKPILKKFIKKTKYEADYWIFIITNAFDDNVFFNADYDMAVVTTDGWDKNFSPPSLFEYLLNSIYCCFIYSQQVPSKKKNPKEALEFEIVSHDDTRGCIADFSLNKYDCRIDIVLGYICDEHKEQIKLLYGQAYLDETTTILERKWIGDLGEKDTVAYNLKHIFKFDINKDSGFNKTALDKIKESFYEIPSDLTKEILKVILTAVLTYFLIRYGLPAK